MKPHIAMLIPTLDKIGGAERQVLLLANQLSSRGWQVTLITLSSNSSRATGKQISQSPHPGVQSVNLGMRKAWIDPLGWLRYLAWHREHRPDIVHAHLPHASWFARWVRLLAPVSVLIDTIHTSHTGSSSKRIAYRISNPLSTFVTCVSQAVADSVIAARIATADKITVLPNGVILPTSKRQTASPQKTFQWIAVGRLSPVKDYTTLLKAFAKIPNNASLLILGEGPEEAKLKHLAANLGIQSRIHFAGFQSDVTSFLEQADAFVLSSRWEGLPLSVLEASALGIPIVATDGAGTREALIDQHSGLIVPVGDVLALAAAMSAIMSLSREDRHIMGNTGHEFVKAKFEIGQIVEQWETLYSDLLTKNPNPRRWR